MLNLDQYNKLDPANRSHDEDISPHGGETGAMRELIRRFEDHKYTFEQDQQQDIVIDLPAPLDGITVEGYVDQGALRIKQYDSTTANVELVLTESSSTMAHFMDHCVDKVVRLVDDQIRMIHQKAGLRPRVRLRSLRSIDLTVFRSSCLSVALEVRLIFKVLCVTPYKAMMAFQGLAYQFMCRPSLCEIRAL